MGLYIMLSDWSKNNMQSVDDHELNELYKEVYELDNSLLISEYKIPKRKKWFSKIEYEHIYTLYHECFNSKGQSMMEAREMLCASGNKRIVEAYLYGLMNGINHKRNGK